MESTLHIWPQFTTGIVEHLTTDDDPDLWAAAIEGVLGDATFLCERSEGETPVYVRVGCCSHWLSPHNNGSWLKDARFAWPSGYGDSGWSIRGLPEFDWSVIWEWNARNEAWNISQRVEGKRPLTLRMTVPARTARHSRAVIHALWTPGSPTTPKKKLTQAYGFEKTDGKWRLSAAFGDKRPYEIE